MNLTLLQTRYPLISLWIKTPWITCDNCDKRLLKKDAFKLYHKIAQRFFPDFFCNENCARMYVKDPNTIAVTFFTEDGKYFSQWWW